jgi:hypothetical protein
VRQQVDFKIVDCSARGIEIQQQQQRHATNKSQLFHENINIKKLDNQNLYNEVGVEDRRKVEKNGDMYFGISQLALLSCSNAQRLTQLSSFIYCKYFTT